MGRDGGFRLWGKELGSLYRPVAARYERKLLVLAVAFAVVLILFVFMLLGITLLARWAVKHFTKP